MKNLYTYTYDNKFDIIDTDGIYLLIKSKYGMHRVKKNHFKNGHIPTIQSAVDKNLFFKNQAICVHGNKYDYSKVKYVNALTKVLVICPKHGEFHITPNQHLCKKVGCINCSKERKNVRLNTLKQFIEKSTLKHNGFYDYSLIKEYNGQKQLVEIICPIHGNFKQIAKDHLKGSGCSGCAHLRISESRRKNPTGWEWKDWIKASECSKRFDSFKIYFILCNNETESFVKIGRTFLTVKNRFRNINLMPYNYKILFEINDIAKNVLNLEKILDIKFENYKYIPKKSFNGMYECFSIDILNDKKFIDIYNTYSCNNVSK